MHRLRLYAPLIGLMISILLICDTLAFKVIVIKGHDFAVSGLIFPLGFLLASVITEVYGYALAGRIIWVQMLCQATFILTVNLFVIMPSSGDSLVTAHYFYIYHQFWHVLLGSTCAVVAAYFINDIMMSKLKIYLSGNYFIIRFVISNVISAGILVFISYPMNLYGLYSIDKILIVAFDTWIFKIFLAIILFPVAIFLQNTIKRIEKLDYFDYGISYNPFTVFNEHVQGINKFGEHGMDKGWQHEDCSNH